MNLKFLLVFAVLLSAINFSALQAQEKVPVIIYYDDEKGTIKEIYSVIEYPDQDTTLRDGSFRRFHPNSNLSLEVMYFTGLKNGLMKEYYDDGETLMRVTYFKSDTAQGQFKAYYPDGAILQEGSFENGILAGEVKSYFQNGNLKALGNFENGLPEGIALELDIKGDTIYQYSYHQGLLEGKSKKYKEGKINEISHYTKGTLNGEYHSYHPNGEVYIKGNYKNGRPNGLWLFYNEEGILIKEEQRGR